MKPELKKLLDLWREAHTINYNNCNCIGKVDLTQEHFKIVNRIEFERESWIAVNKSMIHGDWEAAFNDYEAAYSALFNHIREQVEEVIFMFINNHDHCKGLKFEYIAAKMNAMYRIHDQLNAL